MAKEITIVGGGLAGLTLGIGLRQRGTPATVWEAGHYPRHRVCGEFICGRGQDTLARLGLLDALEKTGAYSGRSAAFFDGTASIPPRPLPRPALCLSRFEMDHLLALEFQRLGGELKQGERWRGGDSAGTVFANGRHMEPIVDGWRWIGLKTHARNVTPSTDMEIHFVPSGYVGLCRLPGGVINVCGLFRSATPFPDLSRHWRKWLEGPPGSVLHSRLNEAEFEEDAFCAVAGLDMRPQRASVRHTCCIGDALTMIPPVTGNGMSMALESAELAIDPLVKFSHSGLAWSQAQQQIAIACDARFRRRLWWAARLQKALFVAPARSTLLHLVSHSERLGRILFAVTR